jgi:F-type H+-transporting ATPase subunit epsilon
VAHTKYQVEVLTPEGKVFDDEVEQVSTITSIGSIGLLAGHQPILAMLEPAELRLYKTESDVVRYAQAEGYLQVAGGRALILVEEAIPPEDLDAADIRSRLDQARKEAERAGEDSEERRRAERDIARLEVFEKLAGGGT